jgi:hypothetical protein
MRVAILLAALLAASTAQAQDDDCKYISPQECLYYFGKPETPAMKRELAEAERHKLPGQTCARHHGKVSCFIPGSKDDPWEQDMERIWREAHPESHPGGAFPSR